MISDKDIAEAYQRNNDADFLTRVAEGVYLLRMSDEKLVRKMNSYAVMKTIDPKWFELKFSPQVYPTNEMENDWEDVNKMDAEMHGNTHIFRVITNIGGGTYDVIANFLSLKEAVDYMRNWDSSDMHSWHIIDSTTDQRFQMNPAGTDLVEYVYDDLDIADTVLE